MTLYSQAVRHNQTIHLTALVAAVGAAAAALRWVSLQTDRLNAY